MAKSAENCNSDVAISALPNGLEQFASFEEQDQYSFAHYSSGKSDCESIGRESIGTNIKTTRQLRSRTIVTTASSVSTKIKSTTKGRLRTQTFTKSSSPSRAKTSVSLQETSKKQSAATDRLSKNKQIKKIKKRSSLFPSEIHKHPTPTRIAARTLVHQDTLDVATDPKKRDRTHDNPRLFNESTSRAFRISNPNSPVNTTQSTPKRLSIVHITFDKENTPPSVQTAEEAVTLASPKPHPQDYAASKITQDKTLKSNRKSLLPKRSNGLRRIVANPSPSSARAPKTNRSISSKLKRLSIEANSIKPPGESLSKENRDLISPDSDSGSSCTAKSNPAVETTERNSKLLSLANFNSAQVATKICFDKPTAPESVTSPVKFYERAPAEAKKASECRGSSIATALTFTSSEETSPSPAQCANPLPSSLPNPRASILRSQYSLASSSCSPLLAAVLTRPLMQSSLYSNKINCQSCQCRCLPSERNGAQLNLSDEQTLKGFPFSFLAATSELEGCSRVWPDEGPDREVENTMSNPQPCTGRSEIMKNPIAATFMDDPSDQFNFRPIHVPTKIVLQKSGSAFSRIIVC